MVNDIIHRELGVLTIAMPENQNSQGAIFGGWMMSQMDLAGSIVCRKFQKTPAVESMVTVNVERLNFKKPVYSGDVIECWVEVLDIGRTSILTEIKVYVRRKQSTYPITEEIVADGLFKYVNLHNKTPAEVNKYAT
jgi:acyl-CoA thioesterase YciA